MQINVPYKIRAFLYIATGLVTPIVAYFLVKGTIGHLEMSLWAAEVTFVMGIAGLNTAPNIHDYDSAIRVLKTDPIVLPKKVKPQPTVTHQEPYSQPQPTVNYVGEQQKPYDVMPQVDDVNLMS